ncbi:hypothetical protein [Hymenobacter latericus]|uniref:hypothetical protein n=1 Tax=Hymenobacter sp. YIM 151858-1 TaxID=2987688 RepID=UPI0022262E3B|nr:hypothetical protein [Hymenobacter sp. YIM 151858-1]UYZ60063.1 hypothetical protein OIS50_04505 [Hymenobacter sp. YIM 151858-1]
MKNTPLLAFVIMGKFAAIGTAYAHDKNEANSITRNAGHYNFEIWGEGEPTKVKKPGFKKWNFNG